MLAMTLSRPVICLDRMHMCLGIPHAGGRLLLPSGGLLVIFTTYQNLDFKTAQGVKLGSIPILQRHHDIYIP